MWSAAAAVTCATVGLSGAVAASAAPAKNTPATQAATSPAGGGRTVVYPRLDTANIVTNFAGGAAPVAVQQTDVLTGSARRGIPWVHSPVNTAGTRWVNLSSVFPGFVYDISLAPAPSSAATAANPLTTIGVPGGLVRVTVRKADGRIFFADCRVSIVTPLAPATCTGQTEIPPNS
ncbi:hypothetical protein AAH991_13895 [Microbispora sp. ZYX-F-249]|uniref:Secreted protein n=1 Tax=Microbispora maris TaxID=3144104 RepID=A0ABV0ALR5_9ACTN